MHFPGMSRLERAFVWTGGGMFVASLAMTAWFEISIWGDPKPFAGWSVVLADTLIFSGFALHHSVFARDRVKALISSVVPARLMRSVYVWTASLLLILVLAFWQDIGGTIYQTSGWLAAVYAAVQLSGLWLIAGAVRAIDPLELAGIRQQTASQDLQTRGPYGLVRHPLYLGWILLVFGAAQLTGDRFAFAVISSAYLCVAVPWEERSLEATFGKTYAEYKKRVRWKIVPYVY
jgi:protein-S-isoprenylcysteine O-methyltransferase Ste14